MATGDVHVLNQKSLCLIALLLMMLYAVISAFGVVMFVSACSRSLSLHAGSKGTGETCLWLHRMLFSSHCGTTFVEDGHVVCVNLLMSTFKVIWTFDRILISDAFATVQRACSANGFCSFGEYYMSVLAVSLLNFAQ